MRAKIFTLVIGLALVAYLPLLAQTPEEQQPLDAQEYTTPEAQPSATEEYAVEAPVEPEDPMAAEGTAAEEASTVAAEETASPEELPRTAGPVPLLLLVGGASAAVGLGLRFARRK